MLALLLSLKGTTLLYQGEELGLPQAQSLTRIEIRDPVGDLYWPISKGRDGSRTPMPWAPGENLGFSSAKPWLPSAPEHRDLTVAAQAADRNSILAFSKALIALRKASPALTRARSRCCRRKARCWLSRGRKGLSRCSACSTWALSPPSSRRPGW
uniref:Glycosyl hydrolase family 13 catalytic domain-containing protein n=1 Tax=Phenylobacterium glaciei TaxID=2803784 RepID=A0A974P382_9CAUL|nr:hypothetical protein JKL49_27065 [Phenylobacterium glaciei]